MIMDSILLCHKVCCYPASKIVAETRRGEDFEGLSQSDQLNLDRERIYLFERGLKTRIDRMADIERRFDEYAAEMGPDRTMVLRRVKLEHKVAVSDIFFIEEELEWMWIPQRDLLQALLLLNGGDDTKSVHIIRRKEELELHFKVFKHLLIRSSLETMLLKVRNLIEAIFMPKPETREYRGVPITRAFQSAGSKKLQEILKPNLY